MKFGEKLKKARLEKGLSQEDLARKVGVSLRTIMNYENQNRYPKKREVYGMLADALDLNINYLLSEEDDFLLTAGDEYGSRGAKQAQEALAFVNGLFAGGELAEEDKDELMKSIQEAYWIAKKKNKKYTPKKYLHDTSSGVSESEKKSD